MLLSEIVSAEAVWERHFFLENMNLPIVIGGIRVIGAAVLGFFIISYFKYKKK